MLRRGIGMLFLFLTLTTQCYGADKPFNEKSKVHYEKDTVHTYEHTESGLSVIWIENKDIRKSFTLGVKTPATDSTGVNHIIEHTVFTGSENYPSPALFFDASSAYPHLFMNALTSGDMTIYPFSTPYMSCYTPLLKIYLESIFRPNMVNQSNGFYEESFNYNPHTNAWGGVVYNEMKGAYNSVDRVIYRSIRETIYKGTPYANDSGGSPDEIPTLTYDAFVGTYKKYYYPANMKVVLYGELPIEEVLGTIDSYMSGYKKSEEEIDLSVGIAKQGYQKYAAMPESEKSCLIKSFALPRKLTVQEMQEIDLWFQAYLINPNSSFQKQMRQRHFDNVKIVKDEDLPYPIYSIIVQDIACPQIDEADRLLQSIFKQIEEDWRKDKIAEQDAIKQAKLTFIDEDYNMHRGINMAQSILDGWAHERPLDQYFIKKDHIKNIKHLHNDTARKFLEEAYCATIELFPASQTIASPMTLTKVRPKEWGIVMQNMNVWQAHHKKTQLEPVTLTDFIINTQQGVTIKSHKDQVYLSSNVPEGLARSQLYYNTSHIEQKQLPYMFLYAYLLEESAKELSPFKGVLEAKCIAFNNEVGYSPFLKIKVLSGEDDKDHGKLFIEARENLLLKDTLWYQHKLIQFTSGLKEAWSSNILSALSSLDMGCETRAKRYVYEQGSPLYRLSDTINQQSETDWITRIKEMDKLVYNREGLIIATAVPKCYMNHYEKSWNKVVKAQPYLPISEPQYQFEVQPQKSMLINDTQVDYIYLQYTKPQEALDGIDYLTSTYLTKYYLNPQIRIKLGAYGAGCQLGGVDTLSIFTYRDPDYNVSMNILKAIPEHLKEEIDPILLQKSKIEALSTVHHQFRLLANEMDKTDQEERHILMGVQKDYISTLQNQIIAGTQKDIQQKSALFKTILEKGGLGIATNKNKISTNYYKIYHFN